MKKSNLYLSMGIILIILSIIIDFFTIIRYHYGSKISGILFAIGIILFLIALKIKKRI